MNKTEIALEIMKAKLTGAEIIELMECLKMKHGMESKTAQRKLKIGDRVKFDGGKHGQITGKVEAIAIKYVKVRDDSGLRWSVAGLSLTKI